jgi:hypothetical protein
VAGATPEDDGVTGACVRACIDMAGGAGMTAGADAVRAGVAPGGDVVAATAADGLADAATGAEGVAWAKAAATPGFEPAAVATPWPAVAMAGPGLPGGWMCTTAAGDDPLAVSAAPPHAPTSSEATHAVTRATPQV